MGFRHDYYANNFYYYFTWETMVSTRIGVHAVGLGVAASRNHHFRSEIVYSWDGKCGVSRAWIHILFGFPLAIGRVLFLALGGGVAVVAVAANAPAPVRTPHHQTAATRPATLGDREFVRRFQACSLAISGIPMVGT